MVSVWTTTQEILQLGICAGWAGASVEVIVFDREISISIGSTAESLGLRHRETQVWAGLHAS
jgi:uncharacterized ferredoxin-like protein